MRFGLNANPTALVTSAIGTVAVMVLPIAHSTRADAAIQNVGAAAVRLGGPSVVFADPKTGIILPGWNGEGMPPAVTWPYGGALYAVCGAGTSTTISGFDVR